MSTNEPLLTLRLQGSEVSEGRIGMDELASLLKKLQLCIKRVGQVLNGQVSGLRPGPIRHDIDEACTLDVTMFSPGSVVIGLDSQLGYAAQLPMFGQQRPLGQAAVETLVDGISLLSSENPRLANEFDFGVLTSLRDVTQVFNRGVESIVFSLSSRPESAREAVLDRRVRDLVLDNIVGSVKSAIEIKGRLREVNLERRTCQIFLSHGGHVICEFEEQHESAIRDGLDQYVTAAGEATVREANGHISRMKIKDVEVSEFVDLPILVSEAHSPFPASAFLAALRESGLVGMWKDRDDITDSNEFADRLREQALRRDES